MPGEHETPFYKLPYPDPNGLITNGPKDFEELAKTVDTALAHSTLLWAAQAGSGTAKSGQLLQMTAPGTVSLPAPAVNAIVGVFCSEVASPSKVSSVAGGGVIAWTGGTGQTLTLLTKQFVLLQGNGTDWLLIAGAPKLEQSYVYQGYTQAEAVAGAEPSAVRPAAVTLSISPKIEWVSLFVEVNGVIVATMETRATTPSVIPIAIPFVPAGQKWRIKVLNGSLVAGAGAVQTATCLL